MSDGGQIGDSAVNYLATPTGALSIRDEIVMTHQVALIIPLGR